MARAYLILGISTEAPFVARPFYSHQEARFMAHYYTDGRPNTLHVEALSADGVDDADAMRRLEALVRESPEFGWADEEIVRERKRRAGIEDAQPKPTVTKVIGVLERVFPGLFADRKLRGDQEPPALHVGGFTSISLKDLLVIAHNRCEKATLDLRLVAENYRGARITISEK